MYYLLFVKNKFKKVSITKYPGLLARKRNTTINTIVNIRILQIVKNLKNLDRIRLLSNCYKKPRNLQYKEIYAIRKSQ